jgi:ATP-dependent Lon protease
VLEDIRKHLALCIDSNDSVELPPMLLLGEPGIGKTHFARKVPSCSAPASASCR